MCKLQDDMLKINFELTIFVFCIGISLHVSVNLLEKELRRMNLELGLLLVNHFAML